ncbi:hypothetical protein NM208_g8658 [Fusarium decemcellulare]|uniref:Uncharacterized protein n=1 Tax=Fusarium decemcellulare TaxID=57161 RepID=A0ACC1S4T4_9HYPO|nr:hypothetical protein NM208_g8658 [Fusarium decemcellulare]
MDEFDFDLHPEGEHGDFRVRNLAGEDFRTLLVDTPNASSPLSIKINLIEAHHGQMQNDQAQVVGASLIVLDMRFMSSEEGRRYKRIVVDLEFFDKESFRGGKKTDHLPIVASLAPKDRHWLNKTTREKHVQYGTTTTAGANVIPVTLEAGAHWEVDYSKSTSFKATVQGRTVRSIRYSPKENGVQWTMEENKDQDDGVPSFLRAAVLLHRTPESSSRPFLARVNVNSTVDLGSQSRRMCSFTTDTDNCIDTVAFHPDKTQFRNHSFTGITPADLKDMGALPIHKYFRINLLGDNTSVLDSDTQDQTASTQEYIPWTIERELDPARLEQGDDNHVESAQSLDQEARAVLDGASGTFTEATLNEAVKALSRAAEAAALAAEAAAKAAEAAGKIADALQNLRG